MDITIQISIGIALFVALLLVYYLIKVRRPTKLKTSDVGIKPPLVFDDSLKEELTPGWYPNTEASHETYYDGSTWGETRLYTGAGRDRS